LSSPNVGRLIKSGREGWTERIACVGNVIIQIGETTPHRTTRKCAELFLMVCAEGDT